MVIHMVPNYFVQISQLKDLRLVLLLSMMKSNKTNINKLSSECSMIKFKDHQSLASIYTDTFKHIYRHLSHL